MRFANFFSGSDKSGILHYQLITKIHMMSNQVTDKIALREKLSEFAEILEKYRPTMLIFISALAFAMFSVFSYYYWKTPNWVTFLSALTSLHLAGTVVHEASHGIASSNKFVNEVMGHISAVMLGFSFPVFKRVHIQHHIHVNNPTLDPDHFISTSGSILLIPIRFLYQEIYFFKYKLWRNYDLLEYLASRLISVSIISLSFYYNFFDFLINFWLLSAGLVGLLLGIFFAFLPHYPFQNRSYWQNSITYHNSIMNVMILGQNYHLLHHLHPTIPWFYYRKAYIKSEEILNRNSCRTSLDVFEPQNFRQFILDILLGVKHSK